MVNPNDFFDALAQQKVTKFSGVPDSLLKDVCAYDFRQRTERRPCYYRK